METDSQEIWQAYAAYGVIDLHDNEMHTYIKVL